MPFQPLNIPLKRMRVTPYQSNRYSSTMPVKGENKRVFSALLQSVNAIKIVNYIPDAKGKMPKRQGMSTFYNQGGTTPTYLLGRFTANILIYGYGTTIAAYNELTGVNTVIKSDFSANSGFQGCRYGEYFFVVNGVDLLYRIDNALTGAFVAGSPIAQTVTPFGARLLLGGLSTDSSAVQYSPIDTGTNPPFNTWTTGTTATDGGIVSYRTGGSVNKIITLGTNIIVLGDSSKWAFQINQQGDGSGTIVKIDQVVQDQRGLGGYDGIVAKSGFYYVNGGGIWKMISIGQPNIPFSIQENTISYVLGRDAFKTDNINFEGASMIHDDINNILYIACKSNGQTFNNYVIVLNTLTGAYSHFLNWKVNSWFIDDNQTVYGGDSVNTKLQKFFVGYDDDGSDISTQIYAEMNAGDFNVMKNLEKIAVQADLAQGSEISFSFDRVNLKGEFESGVAQSPYIMTCTNTSLTLTPDGYDQAFDSPFDGGGTRLEGTFPNYDSYKPFIKNAQRIFVNITSGDDLPHQLNLFFADIKNKNPMRKRTIQPTL